MYTIAKIEAENRMTFKVTETKTEKSEVAFETIEAAWKYLIARHFHLEDEVFAGQIETAVQEGINERKNKYSKTTQIFPTDIAIEGITATIYWHDLPQGHEILRKSTVAALLKFIDESAGWAGDDFKKCLDEVYAMRGKVKFDVPDGHES